jgi:hypothetical protein
MIPRIFVAPWVATNRYCVHNRVLFVLYTDKHRFISLLSIRIQLQKNQYFIPHIFYEEQEQVCDHFPRYHTKILEGDFNTKIGREDIFKPIIGNESIHEASNDNGVRVVNFATSKNRHL